MKSLKKKYKLFMIIVPVVLVLDQITKYWAIKNLKPNNSITVIDGFFNFIYRENKGAAWSFLADSPDSFRIPFFIILTSAAILFVAYLIYKLEDNQKILQYTFPLIIGGALGNLLDRFTNGAVVDFIDWHVKSFHWPTFNIADIALVMAMFLLGLEIIFSIIKEAKEKKLKGKVSKKVEDHQKTQNNPKENTPKND